MNRNNYESLGWVKRSPVTEFNSLFAENVWVVWIEFALSHGVGPLTLALIHLIADEADWKRCWLFSCRWIWVWQTCMPHFVCISARSKHTQAGSVALRFSLGLCFACWLSHVVFTELPSLQQTLLLVICFCAHHPLRTNSRSLFLVIFTSPFCICKQKPAVICEKCWI